MFAPTSVLTNLVGTRCDARHASIAATKINVNALVFDDDEGRGRVPVDAQLAGAIGSQSRRRR
jgi:hypothetical protein